MNRSALAPFVCSLSLAIGALLSLPGHSQTQSKMTQSAGHSLQKVMAALDAAVREYRKRLSTPDANESPDRLREFDESQRKWVEFRKAACDFESSGARGGSVEPMVNSMCWETYTHERLKHLQILLSCTEGDLSCPVPKNGT